MLVHNSSPSDESDSAGECSVNVSLVSQEGESKVLIHETPSLTPNYEQQTQHFECSAVQETLLTPTHDLDKESDNTELMEDNF